MTQSPTAQRFQPFGTTIFAEMTKAAQEAGAINLSQGFPDFEGPPALVEAAQRALASGENQYARPAGHPRLVRALASRLGTRYGLDVDAEREVVVTSGATEGIVATLMGLVDPGDEVVLFEPFYDSYPAAVAMAGGVPRYSTLRFPDFEVDWDDLESLCSAKTRLLVLNSPHNPTGKVFRPDELDRIAELAQRHDFIVLCDEVYEELTYGDVEHVPLMTRPGMRDRVVMLSSAGKTFSMTGWKIGWAVASPPLAAAVMAAHQFITFSVPTPLQVAVGSVLEHHVTKASFDGFRAEYTARRDFLLSALRDAGLRVAEPDGAYFVLADFQAVFEGDDRAFARHLIDRAGVAAIPPSGFYARDVDEGRRLVRFAFCKTLETLQSAADRLRGQTLETRA